MLLVKVKSVAFLKHLVYMVWHAVFPLLHEFELTDIRLEQGGKVGVGTFATLDVKPLLCITQFADKAVVMCKHFVITPYQEHSADDGALLAANNR